MKVGLGSRTAMSTMLARELVMSYGWNATCYQILNPGIEHWFSPNSSGGCRLHSADWCSVGRGRSRCAGESVAGNLCGI